MARRRRQTHAGVVQRGVRRTVRRGGTDSGGSAFRGEAGRASARMRPMAATRLATSLQQADLDGQVVDHGHADYDRLRRVYNAVIDRRPGAIVQVSSPSDVQKVVRIAAAAAVPLAVRGGGHSFAGLST